MSLWVKVLGTLVALEFFFINYLETFATTSNRTQSVFGMSKETLEFEPLNTLFKNQGIYNGLIGILIIIALYIFPDIRWVRLLMCYIIIVAAYGGYTSDHSIFFKQGGLAIITLVLTFVFKNQK